jgi:hypothetical protein
MGPIKFLFGRFPSSLASSVGFALTFSISLALSPIALAQDSTPKADKPKTEKKAAADKPEKGDKATKADKTDKDGKTAAEPEKKDEEISVPIPQGMKAYGIKFPYVDDQGKNMIFEAGEAWKNNETQVEIVKLKITADDDEGKKFYVELPTALLNLETRVLTSDTHVLIRREDFEITGDASEFNAKTRFGKILGNVKMTIFNTENLEAQ